MATVFQQLDWNALEKISTGRVTTYSLLAQYLNTNAVRAVGTAVGKNPNAPHVPCHRVVHADGCIGKYSGSGGVDTKISLLEKEGVLVKSGKVSHFEEVLFQF